MADETNFTPTIEHAPNPYRLSLSYGDNPISSSSLVKVERWAHTKILHARDHGRHAPCWYPEWSGWSASDFNITHHGLPHAIGCSWHDTGDKADEIGPYLQLQNKGTGKFACVPEGDLFDLDRWCRVVMPATTHNDSPLLWMLYGKGLTAASLATFQMTDNTLHTPKHWQRSRSFAWRPNGGAVWESYGSCEGLSQMRTRWATCIGENKRGETEIALYVREDLYDDPATIAEISQHIPGFSKERPKPAWLLAAEADLVEASQYYEQRMVFRDLCNVADNIPGWRNSGKLNGKGAVRSLIGRIASKCLFQGEAVPFKHQDLPRPALEHVYSSLIDAALWLQPVDQAGAHQYMVMVDGAHPAAMLDASGLHTALQEQLARYANGRVELVSYETRA